jgi:hypothetical protein
LLIYGCGFLPVKLDFMVARRNGVCVVVMLKMTGEDVLKWVAVIVEAKYLSFGVIAPLFTSP